MTKLVIQISKGLVRDARSRRTLMFYAVLIALVMLFAGATVLDGWLRGHVLLFIAWWGACAWITLLAVLLALFDMLLIRAASRRARKELAEDYLRRNLPAEDDDAKP